MTSYRFRRRSFMTGVGAAFGLKILLRNLEAMAQGVTSPPRLLLMHWPVGTYREAFLPTGTGTNFTLSTILAPFESLKSDMVVMYGLADRLTCPGGGGHEAGTPFTTTGSNGPGTRANGGEGDDAVAGGPSWDQILLKNVPDLQRPGIGYINTICDARVDSLETSTQCLSYGYTQRSIRAANPSGSMITENTPLLPELSPAQAYMKLFSGFMPGGATSGNMDRALKALQARKSVLDYGLSELATLKALAPGSEAAKIDAHAEVIRKVEAQLSQQINDGMLGTTTGCTVPMAPASSLVGKTGSRFDYGNEATSTSDETTHEAIGKAHAAIILAAFQCDIIRVATFQWSPGTNHVSFSGMYPDTPNGIYMHHPMSHRIQDRNFYNGPIPTAGANASLYRFLVNVQTWYNQKTADILTMFKNATDGFGGNLLDHTVVPYLTEVAEPSHSRSPKASMIFGGRALGMRGGQFLNFTNNRPQVDVWLTLSQAYFKNTTPLNNLTAETFSKTGVGVIPGLWAPPA